MSENKNYDFYIVYVDDNISLHFAFDGTIQIHGGNATEAIEISSAEMLKAIAGYQNMRNYIYG